MLKPMTLALSCLFGGFLALSVAAHVRADEAPEGVLDGKCGTERTVDELPDEEFALKCRALAQKACNGPYQILPPVHMSPPGEIPRWVTFKYECMGIPRTQGIVL